MISETAEQLPDDPEALKALLRQQSEQLENRQQRIRLLEEQILLLQNKRFGSSSEKADSSQINLFNEAETLADDAIEEASPDTPSTETVTYTHRKSAGRKPLPQDLPRVRIEHDLSEEEKICRCGCQMQAMGEVISEQLDIIPAKIQVLEHVRKKYACKACESCVKTAALPPQPIPKSNASPGLLAHIAAAKYQDALPLARQEKIFHRIGVALPRNTLANWMIRSGALIQPLLNLLEDKLREGSIIQCDETPLQVLKEPDKPSQSQSYMWVRRGGLPDQKVILFDYSPSRSGEVAGSLLSGFRGYLQTDDYAGYHAVGNEKSITHLGCWAHARRKFIEAQKIAGGKVKNKGKNHQPSKADIALNYIGHLYGIERKGQGLRPSERYCLRQEESLPLLEKIRIWLDKTLPKVLPKTALGKALGYLHKNWKKLTVYTEDGQLNIDNNAAENAIRPFVIGRKNWLFSDTPRGAKASAALYGLIETAKANGLEPYDYLRRVYTDLPSVQSVEDIEALLPWNL
ncbi:IS66 family transposase [Microbulbifer sp. ZKSA006]|uniref:IS66 family transposase n=1 Tax=Microbulbifer sp. ZKSA006 TaxID=3243390 RepID=UPI00403A7309